jgi:hypothetical protein
MKPMMVTVLLLLLVVVPGLLWFVARALPDTTHHAAERVLSTDVATLRQVLDAVEDQPRWRRALARVEVSGNAWTETDARGRVLRFRWTEQSDDRYRLVFEDDRGLQGTWTATWSPTNEGLRVRVEESITLRHPWSRLMARAFFDPDAFLAAWFDDLEAELSRKATTNG